MIVTAQAKEDVKLRSTVIKYSIVGWCERGKMRRICLSGPVFLFMERGEKLTFEAIWRDPGDVYVLWPRGEFWDVRYRQVRHGQLEWKPIADKPFENEDCAWQMAYQHSLKITSK